MNFNCLYFFDESKVHLGKLYGQSLKVNSEWNKKVNYNVIENKQQQVFNPF